MASEGAAADCKREERAPEDSGVVLDLDADNGSKKPAPLEHDNRTLNFEDLKFYGKPIGKGGCGTVYRGSWKNWDGDVAIKDIQEGDKKAFVKELEELSKLKHPNIIKLYGSCTNDRHCYIVTEFAELGSLYSHIQHEANKGEPNMVWSLRWAADITEGMCYLHGMNVVHRDLKSPNILLTSERIAKICDFGIVREMDCSRTASHQAGTYRWMAPEMINEKRYYKCCDVFSFGMVMWELITHEIPFEGKSDFKVQKAIVNGKRPVIPKNIDGYIYQLIEHCWHMDRKKRPSFCDVQTSLKGKCPVKRLVTDSEVTEAPNTPPVPSQPPNKAHADGSPSNGAVATALSTQTEQAPPPASEPDDETDTPGGTPSPQPKEGNDTNGDSQVASGDGTPSPEQPAKGEQNTTAPANVSPSNGTVAVATPPPSTLQEQAPSQTSNGVATGGVDTDSAAPSTSQLPVQEQPQSSGVATGGVDTDSVAQVTAVPSTSQLPVQEQLQTSGVATGGVDTDSVAQVTAVPSTSQLPVQEQPQSSALADVSLGTSSGSVAANSTPPSSELQRQSSAGYQNPMNIESGLTNKPTYSLNPLGAPAGVSPSNGSVATPPSTQTEQAPPPTNVVADGGHMNTESFSEVTNNSSLQSLYMSGAAVPQTSSGKSTNAAATTRQPVQGQQQGLATADVSATSSTVAASTRSSTHNTLPEQPQQQSHSVEFESRSSIPPVQPRPPTNATAGVSPSNGSVPPSTGTPRSNIQSQTHGGFAEPRNDRDTNPLGNTQALQSQPQKRVEKNGSVAAANSSGIAHPPSQSQTHRAAVSQSRSGRSTNAAVSHQPVQGQHQRLLVNRDDVWELAALLDPIAANWELFFGQLPGFPHGQTKKISANVTKQCEDPKSCFIRGLEKLCESKKSVTYGDIAAIMERPMLPNKPLARRIRRDYAGQCNTFVSSEAVGPLVENYLHEMAASWKMFLRQLRMPGSEVDQIEGCGNYAMMCLSTGLEFWLLEATSPTYQQIAGVLRGNVVTNYPLARKVEEFAKNKCQGSAEVSYTDDTHTPPSPQRAGPVVNIMDQTPLNWEVANGFKWINQQRAEKTFRPTEIFSDKWEGLGKQFGYAPAVLRGYERECLGNNERCFKKVIDRWLEKGSDNYAQTWSGLCEALKDVGGVSKYVASFEDAIRNKKHM